MKCPACYHWKADDKACEHCGHGSPKRAEAYQHPQRDQHQHEQHAPRASKESVDAAIAKMREILHKPRPGNRDWATKILARHERGEKIASIALESARKALGILPPEQKAARSTIDEELKERGVVQHDGSVQQP